MSWLAVMRMMRLLLQISGVLFVKVGGKVLVHDFG